MVTPFGHPVVDKEPSGRRSAQSPLWSPCSANSVVHKLSGILAVDQHVANARDVRFDGYRGDDASFST